MPLCRRRRRSPLASADAIGGNEDMMTEILIRLPSKSLCRFKCVSKRWYSLISHHNFSLLRNPHSISGFLVHKGPYPHPNKPYYKYVHLTGKRPRRTLFQSLTTFVTYPRNVRIMDSCNALYLFRSNVDYRKSTFYLCNPTTMQSAIIPPPSYLPNQYVSSATLAFDPSTSPHYKVFFLLVSLIPGAKRLSTYQIGISSSENGAWRLSSGNPLTTTLYFMNGVFVNGTIHWPSGCYGSCLLFDVDQGCLKTIPMPRILDGRDKRTNIKYFGQSQGHLYLIAHDYDSNSLDVLEIEIDYSKCYMKNRIHLDDIRATFPQCPPFTRLYVLHLLLRKVEEESSLLLYIPGMLVSYNFKDKTLNKLCNASQYVEVSEAYQFNESFVRFL